VQSHASLRRVVDDLRARRPSTRRQRRAQPAAAQWCALCGDEERVDERHCQRCIGSLMFAADACHCRAAGVSCTRTRAYAKQQHKSTLTDKRWQLDTIDVDHAIRRADTRGHGTQHGCGGRVLRIAHRDDARLEDAGLLLRNLFDRIAQHVCMIQSQRCYSTHCWLISVSNSCGERRFDFQLAIESLPLKHWLHLLFLQHQLQSQLHPPFRRQIY
jgi:hypothetical protein